MIAWLLLNVQWVVFQLHSGRDGLGWKIYVFLNGYIPTLFSKSTKQVFRVQGEWDSQYTFVAMVYGQITPIARSLYIRHPGMHRAAPWVWSLWTLPSTQYLIQVVLSGFPPSRVHTCAQKFYHCRPDLNQNCA